MNDEIDLEIQKFIIIKLLPTYRTFILTNHKTILELL